MEGFKYTYWTSNTVLNHWKYYRNEWRIMNWKNQFNLHTAGSKSLRSRDGTQLQCCGLLSNLFVSDHKKQVRYPAMLRQEEGTILKILAHCPAHPFIIQGNKVTQIKQNHRHCETENEVLMMRRKVCNIAIRGSQIQPKQSKKIT